jgi:hypothetical protein
MPKRPAVEHPGAEPSAAAPDLPSASVTSASGPSLGADAALAALGQFAKPLDDVALEAGLNYAQLDGVLRMSLVEAASRRSRNVSQVSVTTGLHRKEVMRLQDLLQAQQAGEKVEAKKRPWASQLVLKWADWVSREPHLGVLPLLDESPDTPCFAKLSRSVTTDVHPRAVLQELLRLGLVREERDRVSLLVAQFVPKGSADDALAVLADNVNDHLRTGLSNIAADVATKRGEVPGDKWLEQAIWAEGISLADLRKLNDAAREAWAHAYRLLYKQLLETPESQQPHDRVKLRVGMYVAAQPMPLPSEEQPEADGSSPASTPTQHTRETP